MTAALSRLFSHGLLERFVDGRFILSSVGSEVVALAAAESRNPKKTVPSAIRKVWIRIVVFYILSVLIVGLLVPSNDPRLRLSTGTAASSPFVIAISDAGINVRERPT